jgi:hypothetical protein
VISSRCRHCSVILSLSVPRRRVLDAGPYRAGAERARDGRGYPMARGIERLSPLFPQKVREPGFYADGAGLYLQVVESAPDENGKRRLTKSWCFRFMLAGRAREMGLGAFHDYGLSDARNRARDARRLVREGIDPIERRKEGKRKNAAAELNVRSILSAFLATWRRSAKGSFGDEASPKGNVKTPGNQRRCRCRKISGVAGSSGRVPTARHHPAVGARGRGSRSGWRGVAARPPPADRRKHRRARRAASMRGAWLAACCGKRRAGRRCGSCS